MQPTNRALRLYPGPQQQLATEEIHADLAFPKGRRASEGSDPYVVVNMVSTLDGKVSVGGKASPIGSPVDRCVMRNIRCAVDAVLVGAGTVRAEEMNLGVPPALSEKRRANGLPEQPLGVILAGSRELPLERNVFGFPGQRTAIIAGEATPRTALKRARSRGVFVLRAEGAERPEPAEVLRLLKEHFGVGAVLLEGGPSVNASFLSSGKVDELFVTLSPKISLSREDTLTLSSPANGAPFATEFDLSSIHSSPKEGELYLRYLSRHP